MLIRLNLFIRRAENGILNIRHLARHITNTANIVHFRRRLSFRQRIGYLSYRMFTHTVAQNIGLTVQQHGMPHLIGPIIVMSKASETRFNTADNDGHVFIGLAHAVGIYNRRPFGTPTGLPARRITVRITDFLGSRFFTEHRIEVSRRNQNTQPRLAENLKRLDIVPIRLRNKAYTITAGFQHASYQSRCKAGVIHIGIPVDIYEVKLIPASFFHIFTTCHQKFRTHRLPLNNQPYYEENKQNYSYNNRNLRPTYNFATTPTPTFYAFRHGGRSLFLQEDRFTRSVVLSHELFPVHTQIGSIGANKALNIYFTGNGGKIFLFQCGQILCFNIDGLGYFRQRATLSFPLGSQYITD